MITDQFGKKWYKGNLHTHSTNSDGRLSPEEVIGLYREEGYDFLALTDHWFMGEERQEENFLLLSGAEYDVGNNVRDGIYHVVGIGMQKEPKLEKGPELQEKQAQLMIDRIHEAGGIAILAHPAWSMNRASEVRLLKDLDGCEIYNTTSGVPWNCRPYSGIILDELAAQGYVLPCMAADDAHQYTGDETKSYLMVQADELTDRDFTKISDGQRQRVLLARAICQQPGVLLLDEPTSFLDVKGKIELLTILQKLAHEQGLAVIVSLHELDMAQKIADAVVCVFPHSVSGALTPKEAFAPENIRALYSLTKEQYEAVFGPEKPAGPKFEHYVRSGQKLLRCGYTTGTCAALGAAGAARLLLTGHAPESVALRTPKGIVVEVAPLYCRPAGAGAECAIEKDGGDDVDVTTGLPVIAAVELLPDTTEIRISGGKGVGRVTKAGLDQPVGEAAINHVPRQMIAEALQREAESACYTGGFAVTISIEGGEEVAKRTFNPHIGVEGGLSVLGTSGIVEPMSQQAILDTIQLEMNQAALRAGSPRRLILAPGNYGLDYLHERYPEFHAVPVVKTSNFIGDTLDMAAAARFEEVLLVGHVGKLVKVAGGIMNTHSHTADCRTELFCTHAALCGASREVCAALMNAATTDACLELLDSAGLRAPVLESLLRAVQLHLDRRACGAFRVGAVLFSNQHGPLGATDTAAQLLNEWKEHWDGTFCRRGPRRTRSHHPAGRGPAAGSRLHHLCGQSGQPGSAGVSEAGVRRIQQRRDDVGTGAGRDAPGGCRRRDHCAAPHRRPLPVWGHPGADGRTGCGWHPLR